MDISTTPPRWAASDASRRRDKTMASVSSRSFTAIDFETATLQRNSACAVGAVVFEDGMAIRKFRQLIRPPGNTYAEFNSRLHGLGPTDTEDAPDFPEVWERVAGLIGDRLVVAHNTDFDMSVLRSSAAHHAYAPDPFTFVCTYRLARSALPRLSSWRLNVLAEAFNIDLAHHDPLSDAEAAGRLWMALPRHFGSTPAELVVRHRQSLGHSR